MNTPPTAPISDALTAILVRDGWCWTYIAFADRYLALLQRGDVDGGMGWGASPEAALTAALNAANVRALAVMPRIALDPRRMPICA